MVEAIAVTPKAMADTREIDIEIPTAALATEERKLGALVAICDQSELINNRKPISVSFAK